MVEEFPDAPTVLQIKQFFALKTIECVVVKRLRGPMDLLAVALQQQQQSHHKAPAYHAAVTVSPLLGHP